MMLPYVVFLAHLLLAEQLYLLLMLEASFSPLFFFYDSFELLTIVLFGALVRMITHDDVVVCGVSSTSTLSAEQTSFSPYFFSGRLWTNDDILLRVLSSWNCTYVT